MPGVKNFLKTIGKRPYWPLVAVGAVLVVVVAVALFYIFRAPEAPADLIVQEEPVPAQKEEEAQEQDLAMRLIDGVMVPRGQESLRPVAVMVDNYFEARPSVGLASAQLVIEAPVEGSITRFLAFFAQEEDVTVGPVRSARPYYVDWASGYGAVYAHVGGSPAGMAAARSSSVIDADDMLGRDYYQSDPARLRPHDTLASTTKLREFAADSGWEEERAIPAWSYAQEEGQPEGEKPPVEGEGLWINFRSGQNEVSWKYDQEEKEYVRHEGGQPHADADGSEIRAKNVVVVGMKMSILDEIGRRKFDTVGEGQAHVFSAGRHLVGLTWKKEEKTSRMKFLQGETEVLLQPGTTWIEVVPTWGTEWGTSN